MRITDLWSNFQFVLGRERVQANIARQAQETLLEAAKILDVLLAEHDAGTVPVDTDMEITLRMRRLASRLFEYYGPVRRGARLFILAKKRARLHALRDAASNLTAGLGQDYDDERELS